MNSLKSIFGDVSIGRKEIMLKMWEFCRLYNINKSLALRMSYAVQLGNIQISSIEDVCRFMVKYPVPNYGVNWKGVAEIRNLSEPFMEEFCEYLEWTNIIKYQSLSEVFIKKNIKKMKSDDLLQLIQTRKLSQKLCRLIIRNISNHHLWLATAYNHEYKLLNQILKQVKEEKTINVFVNRIRQMTKIYKYNGILQMLLKYNLKPKVQDKLEGLNILLNLRGIA